MIDLTGKIIYVVFYNRLNDLGMRVDNFASDGLFEVIAIDESRIKLRSFDEIDDRKIFNWPISAVGIVSSKYFEGLKEKYIKQKFIESCNDVREGYSESEWRRRVIREFGIHGEFIPLRLSEREI